MSDLDLREEPYDGPVAQQLIDAVQQEYVIRYGSPDTTGRVGGTCMPAIDATASA